MTDTAEQQPTTSPTPPASTCKRFVWLTCGVVMGIAIANFWPNEPAYAVTSGSTGKFAATTVELTSLGLANEGFFIVDYPTGVLTGAVIGPSLGKITHRYFRNIAADFGVNPQNKSPEYLLISGRANLRASRQFNPGTGILYVAELTSGKVIAYAFPYRDSNRPIPQPLTLEPVDQFSFRQAIPQE